MDMAELKYFYNVKHNWFLVVHELAVAYCESRLCPGLTIKTCLAKRA